jgi:steroid 5-alpha reductase family enzyme
MISGVGATVAASAAVLFALMLIAWVAALRLDDVSVVVVARGIGLCLVAFLCFALGDGDARRLAVVAGIGFLAGALAAFAPRERSAFDPLQALPRVFLVAGAVVLVVSLPLHGGAGSHDELGALDYLAALVALAGLALALRTRRLGLPLTWWGLYGIALFGGAWWALPGPVVVTALALRRDT